MNWATLEEFVSWYVKNRFPIRPPWQDPVYVTDISMSYVLFRQGQYQVELYLVKPNTRSPEHSHPGVENVILCLGGDINFSHDNVFHDLSKYHTGPGKNGITSQLFGYAGKKLTPENTHALQVGNRGGAFLSIERWKDGAEVNSVTVNWSGDPVDSEHQAIIKTVE